MKNQPKNKGTSKAPNPIDSSAETGPQRGEEAIATRAYYLWEAAGNPEGRDEEFWLRAKEELESRPQS